MKLEDYIGENYVPPQPGTMDQDSALTAARVDDFKRWHHETLARKAVESLKRHHFGALYVSNRNEALRKIMELIPEGVTVGLGDSITLYQIGVISALEKGSYQFLNPWRKGLTKLETYELRRQCLLADVFLTGTNAVTLTGELVNIDSLGNRVAGITFGPRKVIIAVGANKLVNNVEEGLKRSREIAAPMNLVRHHDDSPCTRTGRCNDCEFPRRSCCTVVITERDRQFLWWGEPRITVIIVGEDLGL